MRLLARLGNLSRLQVILLAIPALLPALALLLALCVGVWLPDVWGGTKTLARTRTASGHRFRVDQRWGSDFYTVELIYTLPTGQERRGLIDGDSSQWWGAKLSADESKRTVTVNGETFDWPRDDLVLLREVPFEKGER